MARRKVEAVLQQEIETDDQWAELLKRPGLTVIDVYQSYGGPLKPMEPRFRALNNQLGDSSLSFAIAKADAINALEDYKGRCEPCFLFYGGGELVAVVRGANAPVIIRTITEQLEQEHKVMKGEAQRKPITDPFVEKIRAKKLQDKAEENRKKEAAASSHKPITICIMMPDMTGEMINELATKLIKDKEYEVVDEIKLTLTQEQAHEIFKSHEQSPTFHDLLKHATSGEVFVISLTKASISDQAELVAHFRNDVGPDDFAEVSKHPDCLRAHYATSQVACALHASESVEAVLREHAILFAEPRRKSTSDEHGGEKKETHHEA